MTAPPVFLLRAPMAGIPPELRCASDYTQVARQFIAPPALAYIAGGSAQDLTVRANRRAFGRWAIQPRLLADVRHGHTRLTLNGQAWAHPILLGPVAFQQLAHDRAELDTARAAEATDTCMVCSTLATQPLEDVAHLALGAGQGKAWFQLYLQPDRADTLTLLRRAEAAGFQAIVLTLDAAIQSPSLSALRAGFVMPATCVAVNLQASPGQAVVLNEGDSRVFQGAMRHAPTWADLDWLLAQTRLPVWVKGVMHLGDARALQARGVAGLIVSNHGGRGLDGAPASLDALPAVRRAVGDACPVLFDGGIRSGSDVFKALALGANAVLVGRPQLYALSVAGALGVAHLLKLLREELEICMAMAGCATLADIGAHTLCPAHPAHPDQPMDDRWTDADRD